MATWLPMHRLMPGATVITVTMTMVIRNDRDHGDKHCRSLLGLRDVTALRLSVPLAGTPDGNSASGVTSTPGVRISPRSLRKSCGRYPGATDRRPRHGAPLPTSQARRACLSLATRTTRG